MHLLEKYKQFLPINDDTPIFSLGEGNTPLVKSNNIYKDIGCKELYFKLEGCNPSGSFKDRGMVMAQKLLKKALKKLYVLQLEILVHQHQLLDHIAV